MSFGRMMAMAMEDSAIMVNPMFTGDPFQVADLQVGGQSLAGLEIDLNGDIQAFTSQGPGAVIGTWDGGGVFTRADYDFRFDKTSGLSSLDGPFVESVWYPGNQLISYQVSTMIVAGITGILRMRPTGGGVDIDTSPDMTLSAESI